MTNTAVDKEKVEKRRALGRGLESLLPGPRVVAPGQSGGAGDKQQVPHFVRNDKSIGDGSTTGGGGDAGTRAGVPAPHVPTPHRIDSIQAVVEEAGAEPKPPLLAEDARNGAPGANEIHGGVADETITIYAQAESRMPGNLVVNLDIAAIDKNPFQTRYVDDDEALEELADSIKREWGGAADHGASGG